MAEAMTVETIVEAEWQMRGFWTKLRFPFQTPKGGWSDVDLLAYHPRDRHLVIAESKVRGRKKVVWAYTEYSRKEYGDILDYDDEGIYFSFLNHIKNICKRNVIFPDIDLKKMLAKLTVQLVSNYYIDENVKNDALKTVLARVKKDIPSGIKVEVQLDSTLEVFLRILKKKQ